MTELLSPVGNANMQGVTVRESDGTIDFAKVKEAGFSVVYLRASVGAGYADCRLNINYTAATKAGMSVGFLHELTARNVAEARQQAEFFLKTISGKNTPLRAAMQFNRFRGLSTAGINAIADAFLSAVNLEQGLEPMLKTDAESGDKVWSGDIAEKYPLWIIDENAAAPQVTNGKWSGWTGWEYIDYGEVDSTAELPLTLFTDNIQPREKPAGETKLICVTVAYGDTLSAIAKLFNTTVKDIARLNRISNPNRIYPGQKLYLRVAATTPITCCDSYTVRRGDTLSEIAARFGTTVDRLVDLNDIADRDLILVGQVLKLGLCE